MRVPRRLYDSNKLYSDERFHLLVKAAGRGDEAEEARLLQTPPIKYYTGRDWNIVSKLHACERAATCFVVLVLEHSRDMMNTYVIGFQDNRDMHVEALEILEQLQSLKKTFDIFCEGELGCDPLDAMSFHPCGPGEYLYVDSFPVNDIIDINEEFYKALTSSFH